MNQPETPGPTHRLTNEGVHVAYPGAEEWVIPWAELSDVVAYICDSELSGIVRYLSFGTIYGQEIEVHDEDRGWAQILEQLPHFLPCETSSIGLLSASDPQRTLWSRQSPS